MTAGRTTVACKRACFIIMELLWYGYWNSWWISIRVKSGVLDLEGGNIKVVKHLMSVFFVLDLYEG